MTLLYTGGLIKQLWLQRQHFEVKNSHGYKTSKSLIAHEVIVYYKSERKRKSSKSGKQLPWDETFLSAKLIVWTNFQQLDSQYASDFCLHRSSNFRWHTNEAKWAVTVEPLCVSKDIAAKLQSLSVDNLDTPRAVSRTYG